MQRGGFGAGERRGRTAEQGFDELPLHFQDMAQDRRFDGAVAVFAVVLRAARLAGGGFRAGGFFPRAIGTATRGLRRAAFGGPGHRGVHFVEEGEPARKAGLYEDIIGNYS